MQKEFAHKWDTLDGPGVIKVLPGMDDAVEYVRSLKTKGDTSEVHAFITGSLHLVGTALGYLEGVDAL